MKSCVERKTPKAFSSENELDRHGLTKITKIIRTKLIKPESFKLPLAGCFAESGSLCDDRTEPMPLACAFCNLAAKEGSQSRQQRCPGDSAHINNQGGAIGAIGSQLASTAPAQGTREHGEELVDFTFLGSGLTVLTGPSYTLQAWLLPNLPLSIHTSKVTDFVIFFFMIFFFFLRVIDF